MLLSSLLTPLSRVSRNCDQPRLNNVKLFHHVSICSFLTFINTHFLTFPYQTRYHATENDRTLLRPLFQIYLGFLWHHASFDYAFDISYVLCRSYKSHLYLRCQRRLLQLQTIHYQNLSLMLLGCQTLQINYQV